MESKNQEPTIAIIDYGMGNKRSAQNALRKSGANTVISTNPDQIIDADGIVLPGVGAFPAAMQRIKDKGLLETIKEFRNLGKPVLGICLGMQLMFDRSFEQEETQGLGFIAGEVRQLESTGRKIPVIGWVNVIQRKESPLFKGVENTSAFYHMHSCACVPENEENVIATSNVMGEYVSAVQSDNLFGVQFHPENSGKYPGKVACANFVAICQRQV
jgi:imidazole glycerol-phosphate synthase subunit HisH